MNRYIFSLNINLAMAAPPEQFAARLTDAGIKLTPTGLTWLFHLIEHAVVFRDCYHLPPFIVAEEIAKVAAAPLSQRMFRSPSYIANFDQIFDYLQALHAKYGLPIHIFHNDNRLQFGLISHEAYRILTAGLDLVTSLDKEAIREVIEVDYGKAVKFNRLYYYSRSPISIDEILPAFIEQLKAMDGPDDQKVLAKWKMTRQLTKGLVNNGHNYVQHLLQKAKVLYHFDGGTYYVLNPRYVLKDQRERLKSLYESLEAGHQLTLEDNQYLMSLGIYRTSLVRSFFR